ncbi:hypothetical protein TNIN_183241 [Trichonephila inaurata madagascariensis]|uniref:Uncharacterized protein n=1 Tax=Trichonephila inaurata madagascariensis TaxID=2747483 RepID=A0A8X6MC64_9ARAC|nr:hypothetical protein TNIN_183241 [Trichonephila inaurata madagascariensis]
MVKPLPRQVPYDAFARTVKMPDAICSFEYGSEMAVQGLRTMYMSDSLDMLLLLQQEGRHVFSRGYWFRVFDSALRSEKMEGNKKKRDEFRE